MTSILIVEDNDRLRTMMSMALRHAGYAVVEAADGQEALQRLEAGAVDLAIVDLMMPVLDGYALTEALRGAGSDLPILVITAREALEDKRRGFTLGVDDYMVKPVDMEEVLMRVQALLRRSNIVHSRILHAGETTLHEESMTTVSGDTVMVLPHKEFFLLQKLLSYPGRIFTRQTLMDDIWGYDSESDPRTVDVHVKRLREKYWGCSDFEIETVRGLGYRAVLKA